LLNFPIIQFLNSSSMSTEFLPEMEAIAREAGALLLDAFHRHIGYEYKGDVDLVTEADREAEALITARIRGRWPQHDIVAEEGTRRESGSDYRWYVDPLDGTTNFAHGFPVFCVSLGLLHRDELAAGVLYDPIRDELFAAEARGGATLNGRAIHVSGTKRLVESLLATGFPSHKRHQNPNIYFYHQLTLRSHGLRRAGSAALDLASVASGRVDGFWEFNLSPWDTAAGVLLVREAGGVVTRFDGTPWRVDSRETLASNGMIHHELVQEFSQIFQGRGLEPLPSPVEYAKERG
jgi:myo-inositol-1(or 4)-monophosphatase